MTNTNERKTYETEFVFQDGVVTTFTADNALHIQTKYPDGYEICHIWNKEGHFIHYRRPNGYEVWEDYDNNGKMTHAVDSNGYEVWKEYDQNGNRIYSKDSDGFETWFDKDGYCIREKTPCIM